MFNPVTDLPQSTDTPQTDPEQPERPGEPGPDGEGLIVDERDLWARVADAEASLDRCEATAARIEAAR